MLYFRNERHHSTRYLKTDLFLGLLQTHIDKNSEVLATLILEFDEVTWKPSISVSESGTAPYLETAHIGKGLEEDGPISGDCKRPITHHKEGAKAPNNHEPGMSLCQWTLQWQDKNLSMCPGGGGTPLKSG